MKISLPFREEQILRFLARSWSYKQISERMKLRVEHIHTYAHRIRKATGIQDTRNAWECRDFLNGISASPRQSPLPEVTHRQLSCMRLRAQGYDYATIGAMLDLGTQTAQNNVSQGCKRAGIKGKGTGRKRDIAIADYIQTLDRDNMWTPTENTMADPFFN